jgi:prolyl-tRNA synthetase
MGCYGIGISRVMGVIAEHFSDEKGLVWPDSIAPARLYLVRIGDDEDVVAAADSLYNECTEKGISVLYDDRDMRPGEKFGDAELLGIPHRVVVSARTLSEGKLEYKPRQEAEAQSLTHDEFFAKLM